MSSLQLFSNNAVSLLNASISDTDLTLALLPGTGQHFPYPVNPGEFFLLTLEETAAPFNREIVKVISRTGDTCIIDVAGRGQEGTLAKSWPANDTLVDHRITAETMKRALATASGASDRVFDGTFTISVSGSETVLTLDEAFIPLTSAVWVGGLRLKRGIDYTETSTTQLTLNFVVTTVDIDNGQNIIIEYNRL